MQHMMRDLRKYEEFCLDLFEDVDLLAPCVEALAALYEELRLPVLVITAQPMEARKLYEQLRA